MSATPPVIDFEKIAAEDDAYFENFKIYKADIILLVLFLTLFATVFLQFFTRYILNDSLSWTEEAARYLLILLSFAGAVRCQIKGSHIVLEFVDKYYGRKTIYVEILSQILVLFMMIMLVIYAYDVIQKTAHKNMMLLPFPKYYLHVAILIFLSANIMACLASIIKSIKQRRN